MQVTALDTILVIGSSTMTVLLTPRVNPRLVQRVGCFSELHQLVLGLLKLLSRLLVSWHCQKVEMLGDCDQVRNYIEDFLPIGKSS